MRLALIVGCGLTVVLLYTYFDLGQYLSFERIKSERAALAALIEGRYLLALTIFAFVYYLAVTFSLPIATGLSLLAGFLFGVWVGTMLVVLVATLGATTVFLLASTLLAPYMQRLYGARLAELATRFKDNAFRTLLFMRLVPLFPFVLVNLAPAFAQVPTRTFFLATLIGIIPGSAAFVLAGTRLATIDSPGDALSPVTLGALMLLGVVVLLPSVVQRVRKRQRAHSTMRRSQSVVD